MQKTPLLNRQLAGCPYAAAPAPALLPMVSPWCGLGYKGPKPTVCPGYTTQLPEVIEGARARLYWSKGELSAFCDGAPPTDALRYAIEIAESAIADVIEWRATPKDRGGGGG